MSVVHAIVTPSTMNGQAEVGVGVSGGGAAAGVGEEEVEGVISLSGLGLLRGVNGTNHSIIQPPIQRSTSAPPQLHLQQEGFGVIHLTNETAPTQPQTDAALVDMNEPGGHQQQTPSTPNNQTNSNNNSSTHSNGFNHHPYGHTTGETIVINGETIRADDSRLTPEYYHYYFSQKPLDPRLPPPLYNWSNWHPRHQPHQQHHTHAFHIQAQPPLQISESPQLGSVQLGSSPPTELNSLTPLDSTLTNNTITVGAGSSTLHSTANSSPVFTSFPGILPDSSSVSPGGTLGVGNGTVSNDDLEKRISSMTLSASNSDGTPLQLSNYSPANLTPTNANSHLLYPWHASPTQQPQPHPQQHQSPLTHQPQLAYYPPPQPIPALTPTHRPNTNYPHQSPPLLPLQPSPEMQAAAAAAMAMYSHQLNRPPNFNDYRPPQPPPTNYYQPMQSFSPMYRGPPTPTMGPMNHNLLTLMTYQQMLQTQMQQQQHQQAQAAQVHTHHQPHQPHNHKYQPDPYQTGFRGSKPMGGPPMSMQLPQPPMSSIPTLMPSGPQPSSGNLSWLDEFRNSKTNSNYTLHDVVARGVLLDLAMDQHGSRFIQTRLELADPFEKSVGCANILPDLLRLSHDVFGNYVIQKFLEYATVEQRRQFCQGLRGHVLMLSLQMYGCRVIQKSLEVTVTDVDTQLMIVSELNGHVMQCVRDQNGNHVIQKCIERVPPHLITFIVDVFQHQIYALSVHPYGCRVIQRLLEHCTETHRTYILDEIIENVDELCRNQYGNYVIQHILKHGSTWHKSAILAVITGIPIVKPGEPASTITSGPPPGQFSKVLMMAKHKYASNVVEKCFTHAGPKERMDLIDQILGKENQPIPTTTTPTNSSTHANGSSDSSVAPLPHVPFLHMVKDQYGNYVIQKMLDEATDGERACMVTRIKRYGSNLRKIPYGKHIIARIEKLTNTVFNLDENPTAETTPNTTEEGNQPTQFDSTNSTATSSQSTPPTNQTQPVISNQITYVNN